ncbi:nuclear transport factor 2 family protein [Erythrobacter sp.]|uniref:nuclear transport factor 2 family protein n=1 Tax=Erythrobacter sp. TaxID=1042 RepID=UPI002EB649E1|nr:nuclear transport factor 2 family protein [Erythrobacter sp.]
MNAPSPGELVRLIFAHAGRGEWDVIEPHFSDDLVIHEPASLPYGGEWRGRDALRRLYAHVMEYWEDPEVVVEAITQGGDHAVAVLSFAMTARSTGRRIATHVTEVSRMEGGKLAEMRIHYFDTAALLEALGE